MESNFEKYKLLRKHKERNPYKKKKNNTILVVQTIFCL